MKNGLRNNKEFVNHKILDCIGDLYTCGYRIVGKYKMLSRWSFFNKSIIKKSI